MPAFDWRSFLENNNIPYRERGANVSAGNIVTRCFLCGDSDHGEHMGLNLETGMWGCWRNAEHRGRRPHKLIQAYLGCSFEEAERLAGVVGVSMGTDPTFGDEVSKLLGNTEPKKQQIQKLEFLPEFKSISELGFGKLFVEYLVSRGYSKDEAYKLSDNYNLQYTTTGPFRYRVIVPIHFNDNLVNWAGRSIVADAVPKYRMLSTDATKSEANKLPRAILSTSELLFNYNNLWSNTDSTTLVVCEGPFDALNLDFRGKEHGIRSTCLFTKTMSSIQAEMLKQISHKFNKRFIVLDEDAQLDSFKILDQLDGFGFKSIALKGVKDPALLTTKDVLKLFS